MKTGYRSPPRPTQLYWLIALLLTIALLSACSESTGTFHSSKNKNAGQTSSFVNAAVWDNDNKQLSISGTSPVNGINVVVTDKTNGTKLGSALVKDNQWALQTALTNAPCNVAVRVQVAVETVGVRNSNNCVAGNTSARAIPRATSGVGTLAAGEPNAVIIAPSANVTVVVGKTVEFLATGSDPNNNYPLSYHWDFAGASLNTKVQNPGAVVMNRPGTFVVTLKVTNSIGVVDSTPATRVVTVISPNTPTATTPVAIIDSPVGDQTIAVGTAITFSGSATFAGTASNLSYLWNFGGAAPNRISQNPGSLTFSKAGTFVVTLSVTDTVTGVRNQNLAQVTITVQATGGNQAPTGVIVSPATDLTIAPGTGVLFEGAGSDPDNNVPLKYMWQFEGAAPNSVTQNPGTITFTNPGIYHVKLVVRDSLNLADSNPPVRVITVDPTTVNAGDLPDSIIESPAGDVTIDVGGSVDFMGNGVSPAGNDPLTYLWTFDGAAPDSMDQNPGEIIFAEAGVYTVTLTAIDTLGQADDTPAEVVVTVVDATAAPRGRIESPDGRKTRIDVGTSVQFRGQGRDPNNLELTYLWNFDGAAPDSMEQNPIIPFDVTGTFEVTLTVINSDGVADPTPASVKIKVTDSNAAPPGTPDLPPEPNSVINEPAADTEIQAGDSVFFKGHAHLADPNATYEYLWDFDGAADPATVAEPGLITFADPGVYTVTFVVTDVTSGIMDSTPASVVITVVDPNAGNGAAAERPITMIVSPDADVTILVGDSVDFMADGNDPAGGDVSFRWEFGRGMPSSNVQNPGMVTFDVPGVYQVELEARSTLTGLSAVEQKVTITVLSSPPP